jgi:hypothetical protein
MADVYDVHVVSAPVGAFTGSTEWPIVYIPANVGKITILSAKATGNTAGTSIGLERRICRYYRLCCWRDIWVYYRPRNF